MKPAAWQKEEARQRRGAPPAPGGEYKPARQRSGMALRMGIMLAVVAVVFGGVFGGQALRGHFIEQFFGSMGAPPQAVSATVAAMEEWQPQKQRASLDVLSGLEGDLLDDPGQDVEAGALLLRLRA